jgi:hypothetical protein
MLTASTVVLEETIGIIQNRVSISSSVAETVDTDPPRVPVREWYSFGGKLLWSADGSYHIFMRYSAPSSSISRSEYLDLAEAARRLGE